jgi:CubicO group peptidase (beta-lactamase class C family)
MIDSRAFDLSTPVVEILGQELLDGLTTGDSHKKVTIEQLMRHTSGIPDFFEEKTPDGKAILDLVLMQDQGFTTKEMINRAKTIRAKGLPGKRARYSDTNYQLLCLILEKVSGESFEKILQDRILNL